KAALDLKATVLGKEHLSLANSYDRLGVLCMDRKENADAESYFKDGLKITQKILDVNSPEVYNRLDHLARCLIKEGKFSEAEGLYLQAQSFWKNAPAKYDERVRAIYALGSLYAEEHKFGAAAPLLQEALQMSEQYNGPYSISLVPYLQRYAYTLY